MVSQGYDRSGHKGSFFLILNPLISIIIFLQIIKELEGINPGLIGYGLRNVCDLPEGNVLKVIPYQSIKEIIVEMNVLEGNQATVLTKKDLFT